MLIEILNHFRLTGRLVMDKRVNKWLKIFLVFIPLAYVFLIFPPDDFIPVIGLLDDLLLLAVTTILFITMCPEDVVREHRLILTGSLPQTKPINLEDYRCETENRDLALGFVSAIGILLLGGFLAGIFLLLFFGVGYWTANLKRSQILSSAVRIGPHQRPILYEDLKEVQKLLPPVEVNLFVIQDPVMNAYTFGYDEPYTIVLTSALVEKLSKDEIRAVIGHEMGHILFGHVRIISIAGTQFGLGRLFFYKWSRSCEYSADAAALIASRGDHIPLTSSLLKLTWGLSDSVDVEEFLAQLNDNPEASALEVLSTHPFISNRIKSLLRLSKRQEIKPLEEPKDS